MFICWCHKCLGHLGFSEVFLLAKTFQNFIYNGWACRLLLKCLFSFNKLIGLASYGWGAQCCCKAFHLWVMCLFFYMVDLCHKSPFTYNGCLGLLATAEVLHAVVGLSTFGWCTWFSSMDAWTCLQPLCVEVQTLSGFPIMHEFRELCNSKTLYIETCFCYSW